MRSLPVQLRACVREVALLRGRHEASDVFVDVTGSDAPQWDVLLSAVAEGLFDGVVVDSVPVVVTDLVQSIQLRRLLRWSACELHVASDRGLGLSGVRGIAFGSAVEQICRAPGSRFSNAESADLAASSGAVAMDGAVDWEAPVPGGSCVGADGRSTEASVLLARLSRVMDEFLDAADDPRRAVVLTLRSDRIKAELRCLRLAELRAAALASL